MVPKLLLLSSLSLLSLAGDLSLSGEVSQEARYYFSPGSYGNHDQSNLSLTIEPEISYGWDEDRKQIVFKPFLRLDDPDSERTHFDIRELSYTGAYEDLTIKAGISKEFWGVTESFHLVDIINQTDSVENIDGEDKLGQPMLNLSYQTSLGNFSAFVLPYFRERTFPGVKGRYRGPLVIETERDPLYTDNDNEKNIDFALRWSHYIGNFEWGLSAFKGTNRDPFFQVSDNGKLMPLYTQIEQFSLDAQYNLNDWLFKTEIVRRDSQLRPSYLATVSGFEYTFSNIKRSGVDIGLLAEWLYDERDIKSQNGFYNHSFFGTRIAFNDEQSTEFLGGFFYNVDEKDISSFRIEANRRITNNWKWETEVNIIHSPNPESGLSSLKKDDYFQLKLSYYW